MVQQAKSEAKSSLKDSNSSIRRATSKALPFPRKLFTLLEESEANKTTHIIEWVEDGTAFFIHEPEEFCDEVMPRYFKKGPYRSFTRQLYIYSFTKIVSGPYTGAFCNPKFQRSDRESSLAIRRMLYVSDRRRKEFKAQKAKKIGKTTTKPESVPSSCQDKACQKAPLSKGDTAKLCSVSLPFSRKLSAPIKKSFPYLMISSKTERNYDDKSSLLSALIEEGTEIVKAQHESNSATPDETESREPKALKALNQAIFTSCLPLDDPCSRDQDDNRLDVHLPSEHADLLNDFEVSTDDFECQMDDEDNTDDANNANESDLACPLVDLMYLQYYEQIELM